MKQVREYLDKITIPEEFLNWALEVLRGQNAIEEQNREVIIKNQQENFNACVKRIDNLINLYISPENVDRELLNEEEFKQQKNILMTEKMRIEEEIRKTESSVNEWLELTEKTFHFATYAKHWFNEGDFEKKTKILHALGENFFLFNQFLSIDLQKPMLALKEELENPIYEIVRVEPGILCQDKSKNSRLQAVFEHWSG